MAAVAAAAALVGVEMVVQDAAGDGWFACGLHSAHQVGTHPQKIPGASLGAE